MLNTINNSLQLLPGNVLPHEWYSIIVDDNGSPDFTAIVILADLVGWYRNLPSCKIDYNNSSLPELIDNKLSVAYDYFTNKFNISRERVRRAFIRLESLDIISREVKYTDLADGSRNNQLFLNIDSSFYSSCFRDADLDIRVGEVSKKVSPQIRNDYISNKKEYKNRSNESNFGKNNLTSVSDKTEGIETRNTEAKISPSRHHNPERTGVGMRVNDITPYKASKPKSSGKKLLRFLKPRKLSDFYPMSDEDVSTLQSSSNRNFTSRAMNEILQDMARKLEKPRFWSKKGFIAYMTEAIKYEKRDAVKTANMDFRISANQTREESRVKLEEEYLTELEYSLQVGPEWHLKKKLASTLERSKAYSLLTSIKTMELKDDAVLRINLTKPVELSQMDKTIILNQAKATHERFEGGEFVCVERVELVAPEEQQNQQYTYQFDNQSIQQSSARYNEPREWQGNAELDEIEDTNIWSQIKRRFAISLGEDGEAIEKHWLSKLTAKIEEEAKSVELTASSEMVRDIVESRYMTQLSRSARESGYYMAGFG